MLKTAGRETTKGYLPGATGIPHISKAQQHSYSTIKPHAASVVGKVGGISTEITLDSGSSVSLLSQETAIQLTGVDSNHYHKCSSKQHLASHCLSKIMSVLM